jgi:hypothetical protein
MKFSKQLMKTFFNKKVIGNVVFYTFIYTCPKLGLIYKTVRIFI